VVQEIAGLFVPPQGCNKNVRVCLGTPTTPAAGVAVPGCGVTGPAGCAVCWFENFRDGQVHAAGDTCCPEGWCLRHTLTVTMGDDGEVTTDLAGLRCTTGSCAMEYSDLGHVKLTRTDTFVDWTGWGGDCSPVGTASTCSVIMDQDRSVAATYELGGTVTGAIEPAAALARAASHIVARKASTFSVAMSGSGYSFAQSGVCSCFVASAGGFTCARATTGSGTVTVTHTASGLSRVLDIDIVGGGGPSAGMGECQGLEKR
jgi:hypothetical protein